MRIGCLVVVFHLLAFQMDAIYDGRMFLAKTWPDEFDLAVTTAVLAMVVFAPVAGYTCMVLDIRAYMRRLRGALVVVVNYFTELPSWARETTPRCLSVFGLSLPCTEAELMQAYRAKVKKLHPDRGGERHEFLRLQAHFELAIEFLREREARIHGRSR
ncbi:MAG: J domain-containing protein [Pirellulales bacterium]|nr:J domain-containing protein [Pirellulales bacterium]